MNDFWFSEKTVQRTGNNLNMVRGFFQILIGFLTTWLLFFEKKIIHILNLLFEFICFFTVKNLYPLLEKLI